MRCLDKVLVFGLVEKYKDVFVDTGTYPGSTAQLAIPKDVGSPTGQGNTHRGLGNNGGSLALVIVGVAFKL